jgi:hypothetical protein
MRVTDLRKRKWQTSNSSVVEQTVVFAANASNAAIVASTSDLLSQFAVLELWRAQRRCHLEEPHFAAPLVSDCRAVRD